MRPLQKCKEEDGWRRSLFLRPILTMYGHYFACWRCVYLLKVFSLCCQGTRPQGLGSRPHPRYRPQVSETRSGTSQTSPEVPIKVPEYRKPFDKKQETWGLQGTPSPDFGDFKESFVCENLKKNIYIFYNFFFLL